MTRVIDAEARRQIALKILARRSQTIKELVKKLILKGISFEDAKSTAQSLEHDGYVDERAIVEDHIRRGLETRLVGRFMLRFELQQRGVKPDIVEEQLDILYPEQEEINTARKFTTRKLGSSSDSPDEKLFRRLGGALQRRGFNPQNIARVMYELERGKDKELLLDI